MSTQLVVPNGFASVPQHLQGQKGENELGAGIQAGFGMIGYKGKVWSIRFKGQELPLMRDDPSDPGPRSSIEVIILRASQFVSKVWYEEGYQDGAKKAPDCFSTNGVTPDAGALKKQSATCAGCPKNAWGSRITDAGKQGKECGDSKRITVVPAQDPRNEAFGGAMLLRVPAASLGDLQTYGDQMAQLGFPNPASYVTRISFDPAAAYPKFVFSAVRPLTPAEFAIVSDLRESQLVSRILAENSEHTQAPKPQALPAAFAQALPAPAAPAPAPAVTAVTPPTAVTTGVTPPTAMPQTVAPPAPTAEAAPADPAIASLDAEIDALLAKKAAAKK